MGNKAPGNCALLILTTGICMRGRDSRLLRAMPAASPRTWKWLVCGPIAERFRIPFTMGSFPSCKYIISPTHLHLKGCFGKGRGIETRGLWVQGGRHWRKIWCRQVGTSYVLHKASSWRRVSKGWNSGLSSAHQAMCLGMRLYLLWKGRFFLNPTTQRVSCINSLKLNFSIWRDWTRWEGAFWMEHCLIPICSFSHSTHVYTGAYCQLYNR